MYNGVRLKPAPPRHSLVNGLVQEVSSEYSSDLLRGKLPKKAKRNVSSKAVLPEYLLNVRSKSEQLTE